MLLTYKRLKVFFAIAIAVYIVMIISVLSDNFIFTFQYITNEAYRDSLINSYNGSLDFFIKSISETEWTFDYSIVFGTFLFQFLIPFIGAFTAIDFLKRHKTVNMFIYNRKGIYKPILWKEAIITSLIYSMAFLISFMIFWLSCILLIGSNFDEGITRPLFADWFGESFYSDHVYTYTFIEGFIKFFYMPFVYNIFGIGLSLLGEKNSKYYTAGPLLYYFGLTVVGSTAISLNLEIGYYLNPTVLMSLGDFYTINSFLILLINSLPLILGLIFIWRETRYGDFEIS
ncbi:hypothetical protein ACFP65_05085 [Marinilactibacillus sp. GCM10026970]|uniref:hypothetical protein n=1 Tax=Marinilactibacillus sp. GCM10026970 TaxID=3252642 RepID=UPI003623DABE